MGPLRHPPVPGGPLRRGTGLAAAAVTLGLLLALAGTAAGAAPAASTAGWTTHPTIKLAFEPKVGKVLIDSAGRTLYVFSKDRRKRPTCVRACASAWPPLVVKAKPGAGAGVIASLLGTVRDANGKLQATYNRWPLYTFSGDSGPHQANGQGLVSFGGKWTTINRSGSPVKR